jgi:hypothetical protein
MKTLLVSTDTLWKNYTVCYLDMFRDEPNSIVERSPSFALRLQTIGTGDMNGIRELFKSGETMILMAAQTAEIEKSKEVEVRVTHNGKLIGVVIDSEIIY